MKRKRFNDEQIAMALHHAEQAGVEETLRRFGISPATFYRWNAKYGGMTTSEVRKLKQLEDENKKLKQLVGDLRVLSHVLI